jgi:uncharacterized membrane protein YoaK (UPF0700 family)
MSAPRDLRAALWPREGDRHGPLVPLLLALTFVTGLVDAASYLRLGHVFVANMTGNVVFLGFALAGARAVSAAASLVSLGAFLCGALAGGRLGALHPHHRGHVLRAANVVQAGLLALALALSASSGEPLHGLARYALIALLALAMGVQNAAAQRLAVPDLTTTVLTRTLTGLAAQAGADGDTTALGRRILAVAAMLLGALVGGLLALRVSVTSALSLALALVAAVAVAVHLASSSRAVWTRA